MIEIREKKKSRWIKILPVSILCLLSQLPSARAQQGSQNKRESRDWGYVIKVTENEVWVDLTEADGLEKGVVLKVFKIVKMKHPVTGETISSRINTGELIVKSPGEGFSITVPEKETSIQDIEVGDIVVLPSALVKKKKKKAPLPAKVYKRLDILWEFVSYGSRFGWSDWYTRYEGDFQYLVIRRILYSIKMGLGGVNGEYPASEFEKLSTEFYYGFVEVRIGVTGFTIGATLQLGLNPEGFGMGGNLKLTIGSDFGTHLEASTYVASYIGAQGSIRLFTPVLSNLMMFGEVVVENLPRNQDIGVRFGVGADYFVSSRVGLKLKIGAGGRTSEVLGPYGGLGVVVQF